MVLYVLSRAFVLIQPHFILETISLGQCFGIHNEMIDISGMLQEEYYQKRSFFSLPPVHIVVPAKGQSRECEIEKHLTSQKIRKACLFQPMWEREEGKGKT